MPAHSAVFKEPEPQPAAPPQIVCPEIGDRLWYVAKVGGKPQLFLVADVHNEHSVTGVSIDPGGWMHARQHVYVKQLPSEHPEPPYCCWPERKPHT